MRRFACAKVRVGHARVPACVKPELGAKVAVELCGAARCRPDSLSAQEARVARRRTGLLVTNLKGRRIRPRAAIPLSPRLLLREAIVPGPRARALPPRRWAKERCEARYTGRIEWHKPGMLTSPRAATGSEHARELIVAKLCRKVSTTTRLPSILPSPARDEGGGGVQPRAGTKIGRVAIAGRTPAATRSKELTKLAKQLQTNPPLHNLPFV
jgi:hypothetical protein